MKKGITIQRDENGTPHVEAGNRTDMYWGQGYAHARDRGMQMLLMRILGQGRVSELLDASEESFNIDKFFRRMNWHNKLSDQMAKLDDKNTGYLNAYSEGVNAAFAKKYPWEFKLLGYKPEPWQSEDSLMISRMVGYLTLAQSQAEIERLFVELVQAGLSEEKLEELFPGNLKDIDVELLKKVKLEEKIIPSHILWNMAIPRMMASNNWVVSGKKTASGKPIVTNDPHLEVNRLPNVWSEIVLKCEDRYIMGGSMPGFPGVLTGRTNDMAWAVTYSFIDAVDSWIEKCNEGKYYREDGDKWIAFEQRKEIIKRKKKEAVEVIFYENDHGVLDGDPNDEGYYLSTRWAPSDSGAVTLSSILGFWDAKTVEGGMDKAGTIESAWDFVFADQKGSIGFQMTGLVPKRSEGISGFIPLPGWKKEYDWQGYHNHEDLPRELNPEKGFFATANNDLNRYGKISPINMPMGSYRADRIDTLLEKRDDFTVEHMEEMHGDVYSLQAESFMEILRPHLPLTPQGEMLKSWDMKYNIDSKGAWLFECFYLELMREVLGKNGFGDTVVDYLAEETGVFIDFYANIDRILLSGKSLWFNGRTREEIFEEVAAKALNTEAKTWSSRQSFTMINILFGGKLPGFLGFDRGPIVAKGNRATVHQGQIYRSAGRTTTFMPSYRIVTDLAEDAIFTNLAGGPSDRKFSRWYTSDLQNWKDGIYKTTRPSTDQKLKKFE